MNLCANNTCQKPCRYTWCREGMSEARRYYDDGFRPHKFPMPCPDEVIAWKCAACGEWQQEADRLHSECSVDWRRPS